MERRIINRESYSAGKVEKNNDDDIYIGQNFVAVIDGVSNKSNIIIDGKKVGIAQIITKAIRKIDRPNAPEYAKTLTFEEFTRFINLYIQKYLQEHNMPEAIGNIEATGVIYSRFYHQIWLVGDCKAICDGEVIQNPLEIDKVYMDIRIKIVQALLQEGYSQEALLEKDVSEEIIKYPEILAQYIKSDEARLEIETYRTQRIKMALLECGFTEPEIEEQALIKKYYNPRDLQLYVKNNPNAKSFGYAIFNGRNTEIKNCKVVNLPPNAHTIKMCSDGFTVDALSQDIGHAVRAIRRRATLDPLSIGKNAHVHTSKQFSQAEKRRAVDDASAVIFDIAYEEKSITEPKLEKDEEYR